MKVLCVNYQSKEAHKVVRHHKKIAVKTDSQN